MLTPRTSPHRKSPPTRERNIRETKTTVPFAGDRGFLFGPGEMAKRIAEYDWKNSPLGPIEKWPTSLKTCVGIILNSPYPMWIGWGPEVILLYNDAYIELIGASKHAWALGKPAALVWYEIWDVCGPLAEKVIRTSESIFAHELQLFLDRGDFLEETYYSFAYSPVRDESGAVVGLFCPCTEETPRVVNQRRSRSLSTLASKAQREKSVPRAVRTALEALQLNISDMPFAAFYVADAKNSTLSLVDSYGLNGEAIAHFTPCLDAGAWGMTDEPHALEVPVELGLPPGAGGQPIKNAVALAVRSPGQNQLLGILLAGISPARRFDDDYRIYYRLVSNHLANAIQSVRSIEEEDQKRAELFAETALQREKLKSIFMQAPVGFCVFEGPNHVYTLANEGYYDLLGDRRDIIGKTVREALPELVRQGFVDLLDRVYETGEPYIGRETPIQFTNENGQAKTLYLDFVYQPKKNAEGVVESIVFVSTDVTAQVEARRQVENLAERLQSAVSSRDEFMSIVSHELKNPITSLKLNLQMTKMRLDPRPEADSAAAKVTRAIDSSSRSVDRLTDLIDDLLDVTRLRNGKFRYEFVPLNVGKLIRDIVERSSEQLRQAGCRWKVDAPEDLEARWDVTRIEQVLVNLISNAMKYAPGTPVEIRVECEGDQVSVHVRDHGPGIPLELREKIFDRFERIESSREVRGLGLGLYISKQIVLAHGGSIQVCSDQESGSDFVVRLPRISVNETLPS